MSTFQEGNTNSFLAGADLSTKQYYVVKRSSSDRQKVVLAAAATDVIVGVLQNAPKSGAEASVRKSNAAGTGLVKAGGTIAIGDKLTSDSNGKAVATTTLGDNYFGIADQVGADGDIIEYTPVSGVVPATS